MAAASKEGVIWKRMLQCLIQGSLRAGPSGSFRTSHQPGGGERGKSVNAQGEPLQ